MYIYIRSMSQYQEKIYDELTAASKQINYHIMKILMYPDSKYVDHWMNEIWGFLFDIDTLKGKNKYPKANFIKKGLSTHNDVLKSRIKLVQKMEKDLKPRYVDPEVIVDSVEKYQDWLAEMLSKEGAVDVDEVKEKLQEILNSTL